jgi:N-acyl-D-amino-acid deacylase
VNATIVDGSSGPAFRGNVPVSKNGMIDNIGSFKPSKNDEIVDAAGLVLAPGFIDIHNHSESGLLRKARRRTRFLKA